MIKHVWEGIYKSFAEIPFSEDAHEESVWLDRSIQRIKQLRKSPSVIHRDNLLPFLTALVHDKRKTLKILDFGGGMGFTYIPVKKALPEGCRIEYHIVEVDQVCKEAGKIFKREKDIFFHISLPAAPKTVDIVHLGSSLQYVADWKETLGKLAAYKPQYFLFMDLYAGNIPTFVTVQNYYGSHMPCWFFNIDEFIQTMKSHGYALQFSSSYLATILGKEGESPMQNFPPKYRLGHAHNLLFIRA